MANHSNRSEFIDMAALWAALDLINGYICIVDGAGRVLFMNSAMKAWLGYAPDFDPAGQELEGLDFIALITPEPSERVLSITGLDNVEKIAKAKASPLIKGDISAGGLLLLEDITERSKIESEMRDSQRQLHDIIESLPDPTIVIDTGSKVLYWNRAMVEMTGYPAEDMVGRSDFEYGRVFYGEQRPLLIDLIINPTSFIREKYPDLQMEGDILTTDNTPTLLKGEPRIMWGRAAPLYDRTGIIVGAIETIRDITERRQQEEALKKSHEQLEQVLDSTVHALAITTEKRDHYTAGHQQRVADLACAIAREMELPHETVENIRIAGVMHDIGKLFVPMDILVNTADLRDIERLFLMTHSEAGFEIVKDIPFPGPIATIIQQHHERLDGSGYPFGLKGEQILIEARILAVADTVEAMASHRPYRAALGIERALEEIQKYAGVRYDAAAVEACVRLINEKGYQLSK